MSAAPAAARGRGLDYEMHSSCGHHWTLRHTACPHCFAELRGRVKAFEDALLEVLEQQCSGGRGHEDELDSMCLSTHADAMRLLAQAGRLRIKTDCGRRVLAVVLPRPEAEG